MPSAIQCDRVKPIRIHRLSNDQISQRVFCLFVSNDNAFSRVYKGNPVYDVKGPCTSVRLNVNARLGRVSGDRAANRTFTLTLFIISDSS